MKKDEFLNLLDKKLQVINERERRDIIDEYRTHIEMKMKEGKTEEEAIEDFGDIDELVDDILDAYKINTDRVHHHDFDRKFNNFMDELFDGFKRFVSSFTSLDADDVIKLIFEFLMILIFLFILRIPFEIASSLGASLLRNLVGFGIGHVLAGLWKFMISLAYVVIFVLALYDLCKKRINRYKSRRNDSTVFDDFKDTMHDFANGKNTYRQRNSSIYDEKDDCSYQDSYRKKKATMSEDDDTYTQEEEVDEDVYEDVNEQPYRRERNYDTYYDDRHSVGIIRTFLRIFFLLIMIPFICVIVGLCCALGAMVVVSIQGVTIFGAYFIVIGGLILTSSFLSALYQLLWRGGRR
ncbi:MULTISPECIES: DUF1700 domain-containing protein [Bacillota]|jgi:uncharacterized membrane protein|uniref:DUF1700 domain-containing protein n=3 Tax=Erysipelotrichaceae TaxID=128827 RepID=A0A7G9GLG3_9FIRM|nr:MULTISPECIES: DUF1700 domain-containing protein [Bacillota]QNM11645.1 DUF1700 domain-containing protein [[Eubacterium] hominis]MCH4285107.1 DUF1700 domain-containing protein [Amedibacillus hominis]RGB56136.1 DUF1700 domain-containing protein [Absiella sp. AM22-9]RGB61897.1 DUF1700 domain-containing protein [Absiella sp. AM10-20]RHU09492.1 DUF1700 domain-containing protein [Absiella sp. AM27-20]